MFNITFFEIQNDALTIVFKCEKVESFKDIEVEFRYRDMERFLVPVFNDNFIVKPSIVDIDLYQVVIPLDSFIKYGKITNLSKQMIWLYVVADGEYFELFLDVNFKEKLKEYKNISINELCNMRLLYRKNKALGIELVSEKVNGVVEIINMSNDSITCKVLNYANDKVINHEKYKLYLKKRTHKNILVYDHELELDCLGDNVFSLQFDKLSYFKLDEITIFDFIICTKEHALTIERPAKIEGNTFKKTFSISSNRNVKAELYVTAGKSLAIRMDKVYKRVFADNIVFDEGKCKIAIPINQINLEGKEREINIGIYRVNKLPNNANDFVLYKQSDVDIEGEFIHITLNLIDTLRDLTTNYEQTYRLFLLVKEQEGWVEYHIASKEELANQCKKRKGNIYLNSSQTTDVILKPQSEKIINLGIVGTCYSRSSFNSKDSYFNKDYKVLFNVGYSYFWISLLSVTSEPIEVDLNNFSDVKEKDLLSISREYEKTLFKELRDANVDYVLIDFFVDAIHGARRIGNKFLGQNNTMHGSNYYKHHILRETEQFDYREPGFFETWKKACDIFIERMSEIIPLEKIILNKGGLTFEYYDENGDRNHFVNNKLFSNKELLNYNLMWEKMNNYFLSKVPIAKMIDMDRYGYIGNSKHPVSMGPHHYEHAYYKSLVGEIAKVIQFDK